MGDRFSAVAARAQSLEGFAQTLGPASTAGRYKLQQSIVDDAIYATVDGGAWTKIIDSSGLTASLDSAYLVGATINVTDAKGAVTLAGTRTSGALLSVTNVAAVTSSFVGVHLDYSGTTTSASWTGLKITVPSTLVRVAVAGEGIFVIDSQSPSPRAIDVSVGNTNGVIAALRYNSSVTLINTSLFGWVVDLTTNVTPAAGQVCGVRINIPATTRVNTAGEGAIAIVSTAVSQRSIDNSVTNTSGTLWSLRYGATATLAGAVIGFAMDLSTSVTPGANAVRCLSLTIPATTRADTAGEASAVSISSSATAMRVIDCAVKNTGAATGIWTLRYLSATTLSAAVTGVSVNLATSVTGGSRVVTGISVSTPAAGATTSACVSLTPGAGCGVLFTAAAGTSHILGPATASLTISAGAATGTSAGRDVTVTAGAASTTGAGGGITLNEGAGAGGGARGTIAIGANVAAVLKFYNTGGAVQQTVSGSRADPEQALSNLLTALAAIGLVVNSTTV